MKAYSIDELEPALAALAGGYDVRVPIALQDGTRAFGTPGEGPLALAGGALPLKVTSVFFPQSQRVFQADLHGLAPAAGVRKPLLVIGLTAEDAECLEFLDRFFADEYRDDLYFRRRDESVVACVSGRCGEDGEFLRIAGGLCDLELAWDGERYLLATYSGAGRAVARCLPPGHDVDVACWEALYRESESLPTEDRDLVTAASELLQAGKVPEAFWEEIADRCIACTSCNLACPTCTCFDMFDWRFREHVERWRLWDSCQLDGFMREASGHNPMGREEHRTRRRIHHKLAADPTRWGVVTCFRCGRCDKVCPTGIGMRAVCREMVDRYGCT